MRVVFSFLVFFAGVFATGLVYLQGLSLWPNFENHPFHEVKLDKAAGSPDYGVQPFLEGQGDIPALRKMLYRWALAKFPSMSSCLVVQDTAETGAIDWTRIKTPQQLEVCLYHVASEAGGAPQLQTWLQDHGLPARTHTVDYSGLNLSAQFVERFGRPQVPSRDFVIMSFSTEARESYRVANPEAPYVLSYLITGHARSVYMSFDEDGRVEYIKQELNWF